MSYPARAEGLVNMIWLTKWPDLVSLFNGISTFVGYLMPKGHSWYYLTHSWEHKRVHTFPKSISLKVGIIVWLEFELAHYDITAQQVSSHYAWGFPAHGTVEKTSWQYATSDSLRSTALECTENKVWMFKDILSNSQGKKYNWKKKYIDKLSILLWEIISRFIYIYIYIYETCNRISLSNVCNYITLYYKEDATQCQFLSRIKPKFEFIISHLLDQLRLKK